MHITHSSQQDSIPNIDNEFSKQNENLNIFLPTHKILSFFLFSKIK